MCACVFMCVFMCVFAVTSLNSECICPSKIHELKSILNLTSNVLGTDQILKIKKSPCMDNRPYKNTFISALDIFPLLISESQYHIYFV